MTTRSSVLLGNPMDRGDWQAAVHGSSNSWTLLKGLSTHARRHTYMHTHIHIRAYRCIEAHVCPYTCTWKMHVFICTHVHVCVCVCVYIHMCVIHTYITYFRTTTDILAMADSH